MKLVSFSTSAQGAQDARIGVVVNDRVIDVAAHLTDAPRDMVGVINQWPSLQPR